jgi:hypothetical protein
MIRKGGCPLPSRSAKLPNINNTWSSFESLYLANEERVPERFQVHIKLRKCLNKTWSMQKSPSGLHAVCGSCTRGSAQGCRLVAKGAALQLATAERIPALSLLTSGGAIQMRTAHSGVGVCQDLIKLWSLGKRHFGMRVI